MDKNLAFSGKTKVIQPVFTDRKLIQSYLLTSAKYDFNIHEKRILTSIVSNLQFMLEGKHLQGHIEKDIWDNYKIIAPFSMFTIPSESYHNVWNAFKSLNNKSFIYRNEEIERVCRVIEIPTLYHIRGYVEFLLTPQLVDVFLDMSKGYSQYQLSVSLNFHSVYSMRLYELLANQEFPISFSIDKLRDMFSLQNKYQLTASFIQRVIEPAKKDLDAYSPVTFDYKLQKQGKKVVSILFMPLHQKSKENIDIETSDLKRQINLSQFIIDSDVRYFLKYTCHYTDRELKNNSNLFESVFNRFSPKSIMQELPSIWERALKTNNPKGYLFGYFKNISQ